MKVDHEPSFPSHSWLGGKTYGKELLVDDARGSSSAVSIILVESPLLRAR